MPFKRKIHHYRTIHAWLVKNFGRGIKCEHCREYRPCQWALLKGKKYEKKRENFLILCSFCHIHYDNPIPWNKGKKTPKETRLKQRLAKLGGKLSEEHKRKIGEAGKGEKNWKWKGGLPKCIDCSIRLGDYHSKRCVTCHHKSIN